MASISQFNSTQLQNALLEREIERRKLVNTELKMQHALVLLHLDTLLLLTPNHQRNCSDDNPCNYSRDLSLRPADCVRCHLLLYKREGYNCDLSVKIELQSTPILSEDTVGIQISFKDK